MTNLMRGSAEDDILHRALRLPSTFPAHLDFLGADGCPLPTKYAFESPYPIGEGGTSLVYRVKDTGKCRVRRKTALVGVAGAIDSQVPSPAAGLQKRTEELSAVVREPRERRATAPI